MVRGVVGVHHPRTANRWQVVRMVVESITAPFTAWGDWDSTIAAPALQAVGTTLSDLDGLLSMDDDSGDEQEYSGDAQQPQSLDHGSAPLVKMGYASL